MEGKGCTAMSGGAEDKKEGGCGTEKKDCGPKKGCCAKMIKGALAGGIVLFAVMAISWMALPLHQKSMHGFTDEAAVAKVLTDNAPEHGVYVLPHVTDMKQAAAVDKPFAFVSVLPSGFDCIKEMPVQMGKQFALCLVLAGILTCMMKQLGSGCPVGFSVKAGLLVALAHNVPYLIWWHFPADFILVSVLDDVVAVTLAGLVISKCVLNCAPKACGTKVACPGCGCTDCKCKSEGGGCGTKKGSCGA